MTTDLDVMATSGFRALMLLLAQLFSVGDTEHSIALRPTSQTALQAILARYGLSVTNQVAITTAVLGPAK